MQLFVTILEETCAAAVAAIRAIDGDHDGVEIRAEQLDRVDLAALREATEKPILLTFRDRGTEAGLGALRPAIAAGIDLVDVEWSPGLERAAVETFRDRIVLSHHDYKGMGGLEEIAERMDAAGCAHVKIAASPMSFAGNERLLALQARRTGAGRRTMIGMGERGLYARILAPFRGAALVFASAGRAAAPGQLTLERANAIFGPRRHDLRADRVFAVAGDPAGHSLSPSIHNRIFRERGVAAAYTIASLDSFDEIGAAFLNGEPCGLSITAPFKQDALDFARRTGATISGPALASGAVNTLLNHGGTIFADNTDVAGFRALLSQVCGRDRKSVAILGAGGTARAALLAVRQEGMPATIFNRTAGKLEARPLEELVRWDGEVVIDTTSADLDVPLRPGMTYIRAAYSGASRAAESARLLGVQVFDGMDLLEAQAVHQSEIFLRVFGREEESR